MLIFCKFPLINLDGLNHLMFLCSSAIEAIKNAHRLELERELQRRCRSENNNNNGNTLLEEIHRQHR